MSLSNQCFYKKEIKDECKKNSEEIGHEGKKSLRSSRNKIFKNIVKIIFILIYYYIVIADGSTI